MATRGTIAVQHADGTVSQIYVHWDSYLDGVGATLLAYYNQYALALRLVSGGDISSLDNSFESTMFYGRDRGEEGTDAREFKNFDSYVDNFNPQEYNYLWKDGAWTVEHYDTGGAYEPLASQVAAD